ncbi:MAG: AraC family transcriptional regulator [Lentisphaeria bacterium]
MKKQSDKKGAAAVLPPALWREVRDRFRRRFGFPVVLAGPDGRLLAGTPGCGGTGTAPACCELRRQAVSEALRWGEPSVLAHGRHWLWAVPVMRNAELLGGLVMTSLPFPAGGEDTGGRQTATVRAACRALLEWAAAQNVTNAALLQARREEAERERRRAEAIHAVKSQGYDSVRELYLREEPGLIAAIKGGDRAGARAILNRVLVGIYHLGGSRLELLKSFALELVVMMSRTAVEAGGKPEQLLGVNFESVTVLGGVRGEEELCHWLTGMLERIMDAIRDQPDRTVEASLARALKFMAAHLGDPNLNRAAAARVACLSPSHFSTVLHRVTGQTFGAHLRRLRVAHACVLLRRPGALLPRTALACGFRDQSHFTKVFRRETGQPPGRFRHRSAA